MYTYIRREKKGTNKQITTQAKKKKTISKVINQCHQCQKVNKGIRGSIVHFPVEQQLTAFELNVDGIEPPQKECEDGNQLLLGSRGSLGQRLQLSLQRLVRRCEWCSDGGTEMP